MGLLCCCWQQVSPVATCSTAAGTALWGLTAEMVVEMGCYPIGTAMSALSALGGVWFPAHGLGRKACCLRTPYGD